MTDFDYWKPIKSANYILINDNDCIILITNEWSGQRSNSCAVRSFPALKDFGELISTMYVYRQRSNVRATGATFYREWCREECCAVNNGCIKIHDMRDHLSSALSQRGCHNYQTKRSQLRRYQFSAARYPISCYSMMESVPLTPHDTDDIPISFDRPRYTYVWYF